MFENPPSVLVVANGELSQGAWFTALLESAEIVVAVDGGAAHIFEEGSVVPNFFVGDEDSLTAEVDLWLTDSGVDRFLFDAAKDESDLALALQKSVAIATGSICVVGVFGGRVDHQLISTSLLASEEFLHQEIYFESAFQRLFVCDSSVSFLVEKSDFVSLIPFGGDVTLSSTSGLRWNLFDDDLVFGSSRGLSNEAVGEQVSLHGIRGILVVVHTSSVWGR